MALSNSRRTKMGISIIKRDTYGPNWYTKVAEIQKRDCNKCIDCNSTQHLHTHHIRALNRGGLTLNSNLITLCEQCHARRHPGNHNIEGFARVRKGITK